MATSGGTSEQMREMYEAVVLKRDELAQENERLRAQLDEQAERVVAAMAERDQYAHEAAQLRRSDRAARRLLIRTEMDERTGEGVGVIAPEALRRALDKGE